MDCKAFPLQTHTHINYLLQTSENFPLDMWVAMVMRAVEVRGTYRNDCKRGLNNFQEHFPNSVLVKSIAGFLTSVFNHFCGMNEPEHFEIASKKVISGCCAQDTIFVLKNV